MNLNNCGTSFLRRSNRLWQIIITVSLLLLVNACASSKALPTKSIWAAQAAIENAERNRVSQYAAAELMQARDFLNRANAAVSQENMLNAEQFAQQSLVTTQLAVARAELVKAQNINNEMSKSITQLDQEMQRNESEKL
jgi:hypothetical protein